jgi:hypothetical protein
MVIGYYGDSALIDATIHLIPVPEHPVSLRGALSKFHRAYA